MIAWELRASERARCLLLASMVPSFDFTRLRIHLPLLLYLHKEPRFYLYEPAGSSLFQHLTIFFFCYRFPARTKEQRRQRQKVAQRRDDDVDVAVIRRCCSCRRWLCHGCWCCWWWWSRESRRRATGRPSGLVDKLTFAKTNRCTREYVHIIWYVRTERCCVPIPSII